MAKKKRYSLSLKMILTTTLIICLLVGLFGLMNTMNIQSIYEKNREQVEQIFKEQMSNKAKTKAETIAFSSLKALLDGHRTRDRGGRPDSVGVEEAFSDL